MTRRQVASFLLGVAAAAIVLLMVFTLVQTNTVVRLIREDQKAGQERSKQTKAIADRIESCTTPEGACYRRGQQNTGAAVSTINEITIYAAACAKQPGIDTAREIRACVEDYLDPADQRRH